MQTQDEGTLLKQKHPPIEAVFQKLVSSSVSIQKRIKQHVVRLVLRAGRGQNAGADGQVQIGTGTLADVFAEPLAVRYNTFRKLKDLNLLLETAFQLLANALREVIIYVTAHSPGGAVDINDTHSFLLVGRPASVRAHRGEKLMPGFGHVFLEAEDVDAAKVVHSGVCHLAVVRHAEMIRVLDAVEAGGDAGELV